MNHWYEQKFWPAVPFLQSASLTLYLFLIRYNLEFISYRRQMALFSKFSLRGRVRERDLAAKVEAWANHRKGGIKSGPNVVVVT